MVPKIKLFWNQQDADAYGISDILSGLPDHVGLIPKPPKTVCLGLLLKKSSQIGWRKHLQEFYWGKDELFPVSYIFLDFPLNKSDVAPCKPKDTLLVKQDTYEPWALSGSAGFGGFSYIYIYMYIYGYVCTFMFSMYFIPWICVYVYIYIYLICIYYTYTKKNTCEFLKEHVDILNAYMYICVYTRI